MELVLASTSPYRRMLLERLGVPFRCHAPQVDEVVLKRQMETSDPRVLAERLAQAKAESLIDLEPDATLIGCDQLVAFEGRILGKPGSPTDAVAQLASMVGRPHELITALVVWSGGRLDRHTEIATLHMRSLTLSEIERYVAADHPVDCAGAYKLEQRGIALFERIVAEDHSAITGLPLIALTSILRDLDFDIP